MRPMHGITSGLLLSCLLASAVAAKAPKTPVSHARSLPAVATVADELSEQPIEALQRYQRGLLTRLLLDQGRVAMAQPDALHSAIVLAAVCVVLTERGAAASPLSLARATSALSTPHTTLQRTNFLSLTHSSLPPQPSRSQRSQECLSSSRLSCTLRRF